MGPSGEDTTNSMKRIEPEIHSSPEGRPLGSGKIRQQELQMILIHEGNEGQTTSKEAPRSEKEELPPVTFEQHRNSSQGCDVAMPLADGPCVDPPEQNQAASTKGSAGNILLILNRDNADDQTGNVPKILEYMQRDNSQQIKTILEATVKSGSVAHSSPTLVRKKMTVGDVVNIELNTIQKLQKQKPTQYQSNPTDILPEVTPTSGAVKQIFEK